MSPPYLLQDDNLLGSEMGCQLTEEIKEIDYMGAAMSDQPCPTLNSSFFFISSEALIAHTFL